MFKSKDQNLEYSTKLPPDLHRLSMLLRYVDSVWAVAVYNNEATQEICFNVLREQIAPLEIHEVVITEPDFDPLYMIKSQRRFQEGESLVVSFVGLLHSFPAIFSYLDLQRETLAELPHSLLFWVTEFERIMLVENAPNFYSRLSGVFRCDNSDTISHPIEYGSETSNIELLHAASNHDPKAMDELYIRTANQIRPLIMNLIHDQGLVEEIIQDVFLRLYNRLDGLKKFTSDSQLASWLRMCAENGTIDYIRRERREPAIDDNIADIAPVWYTDDTFATVLAKDEISNAIASLPYEESEIALLRFVHGFEPAKIAEILNYSPERVRYILYKIRRNLRVQLAM